MINQDYMRQMNMLPVLMYHGIEDPPTEGGDQPGRAHFRVTPARFREHLEVIASMGFQPITFQTLASGVRLPERPLIITFDDGEANNYRQVLPILNEYNYKGVFFVVSGNINSPGWLKAHQVREMAFSGMEIGSHSVTHSYLSSLSYTELLEELMISKDHLESITGEQVISLALPGGRGSRAVGTTAKERGYKFVAGSQPGNNAGAFDTYNVQRWAITERTTVQKLSQILSGQPQMLAATRWKYRLGAVLKSIMGDHLYTKAWHWAAAVRLRLAG